MKRPRETLVHLERGRQMANGTVDECGCDVCSKDDMPIVAADGLLFRCCVKEGSYIPTEMIDQDELIEALKKQILKNGAKRGARSAPTTPSKKERNKKSHFDFNENVSFGSNLKIKSQSDPHPLSKWRERLGSHGSIHRSPTSPTFKTIPKSILLKCRDRKLSNESLPDVFDEIEDVENKVDLHKRFTDQLAWVKENGKDFVAMESLKSMFEVSALLHALANSKATTVLQMKVNCNDIITVSYHFLDNFKQDFMMLKVSNGYCMFMAPF